MAQNNPINESASYSTAGGANAPLQTGANYGANPSAAGSGFEGHGNSGTAGSANTYDDRETGNTGSYGNTHSTTGRSNPIHPSDPQSTANPAYGKHHQYPTSGYETGGGNPGQGIGGNPTGSGNGNYHDNVDAAYGHTTGPTHPSAYETGGGNPGQTASRSNHVHTGNSGLNTGSSAEAGYNGTSERSFGDKVKEGASGLKGMLAGVHGAGEKIRGEFNSGVDRAFDEPSGAARNQQIRNDGDREMQTGQFSAGTKNREGVVQGSDHGERSYRNI